MSQLDRLNNWQIFQWQNSLNSNTPILPNMAHQERTVYNILFDVLFWQSMIVYLWVQRFIHDDILIELHMFARWYLLFLEAI